MSIVGIGQDLIEIERIRHTLERFGERFLKRCYTEGELEFCRQFNDPAPNLAARYAAKEAGAKALGTGLARGVLWREIEVRRTRGEAPTIHFHGNALRFAQRLGIQRAHVTLTHSRGMASAVVIAEKLSD